MSSMPHLKLDVYGVADDLLNALPGIIDMQVVAGPFVYPFVHKRSGSDSPEHYTLDAMTIIATSHISIHTLPHKKLCLIDVFSCKQFDTQAVIDAVCTVFCIEPSSIEIHLTERATRSPREVPSV